MDDAAPRVLIIGDGDELAELIEVALRERGHEVHVEADGWQGYVRSRQFAPDLVILDRALPGMDGLAVCRRLRQDGRMPILILSAHGSVPERIEGLNAGATDYMCKPFELGELVARVHAQLRQYGLRDRTRLCFGELCLDLASRSLSHGERDLSLTRREFDLLSCLMLNANKVLPRARLLAEVWGEDFEGTDNVVEAYVRYVRTKHKAVGLDALVCAVHGVGYVFRPDLLES